MAENSIDNTGLMATVLLGLFSIGVAIYFGVNGTSGVSVLWNGDGDGDVTICNDGSVCGPGDVDPGATRLQVVPLAAHFVCNNLSRPIARVSGLQPGEHLRVDAEPAPAEPIDAAPAAQDGVKIVDWRCAPRQAPGTVQITLTAVQTGRVEELAIDYTSPTEAVLPPKATPAITTDTTPPATTARSHTPTTTTTTAPTTTAVAVVEGELAMSQPVAVLNADSSFRITFTTNLCTIASYTGANQSYITPGWPNVTSDCWLTHGQAFTPATPGTYNITVSARTAQGQQTTKNVTVTI